MLFDPARDIGQQREAGGMRLREAVGGEALDLAEDGLGKVVGVAIGAHAAQDLFVKALQVAGPLPGRHGAAQLVGFARREAGRDHRHLHHLLLKNRDAAGALQRHLECFAGVLNILRPHGPVLQIGVDHAALNRAGPHDGHFHH